MPEEANKKILDRDLSKAGSNQLIKLSCPLLREVVNHATNVYVRCQAASNELGDIDEDVAPFALYRTVFEMIDGVEVLLAESVVVPAITSLRTAFDASLGLEYILKKDSKARALCWVYAYAEKRLQTHQMLAGQGKNGPAFTAAYQAQFGSLPPHATDLAKRIAGMQAVLQKPHFSAVAAEFQARRSRARGLINWYSLFDGPSNLRELAKDLGRLAEYLVLYSSWSSIAHAHNLEHVTTSATGGAADKGVRDAGRMLETANMAVNIQLRSTKAMLKRYRPGEKMDRWYKSEVKPLQDKLQNAKVTFKFLEV